MTEPRALLAGTLIALCSIPAANAQNYTVSSIQRPDQPTDLMLAEPVLADIDGDERQDLMLPYWSPQTGRELWVYRQQQNGRMETRPSRRVEIKPEIVAVAPADLRPEAGSELLLFSATGIFSLSTAMDSYTGNLKHLADWDLAVSVPSRRRTLFFEQAFSDMDGDGYLDLLVPGRESYGYFKGAADETFNLALEFPTLNEELDPAEVPSGGSALATNVQINRRDGIIVDIASVNRSVFDDFVAEWRPPGNVTESDGNQPLPVSDDGSADAGLTLLETELWRPPALRATMDNNQSEDIVFLNIGNDIRGQINIMLQNEDGSYSGAPDWRGPVDVRGEVLLADYDGDGLTDILRVINDSDDWDVRFYRNRGASLDLETPDLVMRYSGYDLNLSFDDLDGDGVPELNVTYYTIPVIDAIRNTSIVRTQLLYAGNRTAGGGQTGQAFNRRPDFRLDERFSPDAIRGLSAQMNLQHDIDNDGRNDAVYLTNEGALAAKALAGDLRIADDPFWQYVPDRTIMNFSIQDLNGDQIPDFILSHSTAISILVSSP